MAYSPLLECIIKIPRIEENANNMAYSPLLECIIKIPRIEENAEGMTVL